jgi:hypothetical protein
LLIKKKDSSSNDVQIVAEKSGTAAKAAHGLKVASTLTEEMLTEHNRLNGTLDCSGAGSFNNHTKEYISKWAAENTAIMLPRTDKPFPAGVVPIESFGPMVVDQPQYLIHQNKSKSTTTATASLITSAPVAIASKPSPLCLSSHEVMTSKKDTEFKLNGNKATVSTAVDLKHLSQIKNAINGSNDHHHAASSNNNGNASYHHQSKINGNSNELIKPQFSNTTTNATSATTTITAIKANNAKSMEMAAVAAAAKKKLNSLNIRQKSGSGGAGRLLVSNNNTTNNNNTHELIAT